MIIILFRLKLNAWKTVTDVLIVLLLQLNAFKDLLLLHSASVRDVI